MKQQLEKVYLLKYNGYGYGYGYGNGNGDGNGDGNGNGDGDGYGYGYGDGYGYGYGYGNGNGYGDGNGNGYGDGNGNGNGYGYGIYKAKLFGEWFEISGKFENSLCNNLPEHHFDKVNKDFIHQIDNLESLRTIREKIGLDKYISLFDAKVIDEKIDHQGNNMKLYKYDEKGTDVILLEVICPSTNRMYHLYPVNQKVKDCFTAKASTFDNKPIAVRHGDCGFVKVGETFTIPFSET